MGDLMHDARSKSAIGSLLCQARVFQKPRLLKPPKMFRDLLNHYHNAPNNLCAECGEKPKKSVICLVCGALLCYSENDYTRSRADINPCQRIGRAENMPRKG